MKKITLLILSLVTAVALIAFYGCLEGADLPFSGSSTGGSGTAGETAKSSETATGTGTGGGGGGGETGNSVSPCGTHTNWNVPDSDLLVHIDFREDADFPCEADPSITVTASSGLTRTATGAQLGASSYVTLKNSGQVISDGSIWIVLKVPAHNGKDAQVFWDCGIPEGMGFSNVVNASKNNKQGGLGYQFEGHYCDIMGMTVPMGAGGIMLEWSGGSGDKSYTINEGDYLCMRYRWMCSTTGDDKGQFGFTYLADSITGPESNVITGKSEEKNFPISSTSQGQGCPSGNMEIDGASYPMIIGKDINSIDTSSANFPMDGEVVAFFLFGTPHPMPEAE